LSISINHSAFVVVGGYLLTMGDNKEGQLGLGHTKDAIHEPTIVKKLMNKFVTVS
jgi:Regulator of chromosome condensation (RCC1) repeat